MLCRVYSAHRDQLSIKQCVSVLVVFFEPVLTGEFAVLGRRDRLCRLKQACKVHYYIKVSEIMTMASASAKISKLYLKLLSPKYFHVTFKPSKPNENSS